MRRIICVCLTLLVCFSFAACGSDSNTQNSEALLFQNGKVELTSDNALDYLVFEIELENIVRWQNNYVDGNEPPEGTATSGFGKCDIIVNVFAKKPVDFDDVKIVFDLVPTHSKYTTIANNELQLKYDGTANAEYKYVCEVGGDDNPLFKVVIKEISGKAVSK